MIKSEQGIWDLYELYPEVRKLSDVGGDDNWARYQITKLRKYVFDKSGKKHDVYYEGEFLESLKRDLVARHGERQG